MQKTCPSLRRICEIPNAINERAQDVARKPGKNVHDPRSFGHKMRRAVESSRILGRGGGEGGIECWGRPMRYNRGRGRFAAWAAPTFGGVPMDAETVNAICNVLLVVIGIIGLLLVRKE